MNRITVIPAYSRDYKSRREVMCAWEDNRDFIVQDMSSPYDGRYINKADADQAGIKVSVRYNKLQRIAMLP